MLRIFPAGIWIKGSAIQIPMDWIPMPQTHRNLNIQSNLISRHKCVGSNHFSYVSCHFIQTTYGKLFLYFFFVLQSWFSIGKPVWFPCFSHSYVIQSYAPKRLRGKVESFEANPQTKNKKTWKPNPCTLFSSTSLQFLLKSFGAFIVFIEILAGMDNKVRDEIWASTS